MQTDEKLDQIFCLRRLENLRAEGWECEYCITGLLLCKSLILQFPDEVIPAPLLTHALPHGVYAQGSGCPGSCD